MSAGGSNNKTSLGSVRTGHPAQAFRHLGLGLIGQGFAPRRPSRPFGCTDAGSGQGLTARRPRLKAHVDHLAARRGLSLSVHGAVVHLRTAKLTETITPERYQNRKTT